MKRETDFNHVDILLVEDNIISQLGTKIVLKQFINCGVEIVDSGDSAIKACKKKFDLILIDINLPDINGIDLMKKIRNKYLKKSYKTLIVAYTAEEKIREKCLSDGFDDFIEKPLKLNDVERLANTFGLKMWKN